MGSLTHRWKGQRNPGERGWQEWFPGKGGLPPRDLTEEDVAGLTDAQRAMLVSPAGQRLYESVEPAPPKEQPPKEPRTKSVPSGSKSGERSDAKPGTTPAPS